MKKETLAKILTYSGSIPFIFLTYLQFCQINQFFNIQTSLILISYAAIILSFISGMHFSYAILQNKITIKLLLLSNVVALLSCFSLLLNFKIALLIISLCYISNLIIDFISYQNLIIPKWFFDLRLRISVIVIFCFFLNFWHIF